MSWLSTLSSGAALVALLSLAAPALAQEAVDTREGPAAISDINEAAPGGDDLDRIRAADAKRDEQIDQLKRIIPKFSDSPQKADLYFQLAELWWEKSKAVYFQEMAAWEEERKVWSAAVDRGEKVEEPQLNNRRSEIYRAEAIKLYNTIIETYPGYERNDEVLFNLAYNMQDTGRPRDAVIMYLRLIKEHPGSRFVPDAYLQMGEYFFNDEKDADVFKAQRAYSKAYELGDARVKPFALYKLAWCDYNMAQFGEAQAKLQQVVALAESGAGDRVQLKSEALRDMIRTFTELGQVDPAISYYQAHTDDAGRWVSALGNSFFGSGNNEAAIQTFRWLIDADPNGVNAPGHQSTIVRAYSNLQQRDRVLVEMKYLVERFGPGGPWAQANAGNEIALARAYNLTEETQRELVTEYHQEALKTKYAETYQLAAEIYKNYLDKFSDSEHAYRLRFYYAQILFTLEDFEPAADQYLKVVEADAEGEHTLEAAYAALLSYQTLADIERGDYVRKNVSGRQKVDEDADKGAVGRKQILRTAQKDDEAEEIPRWELKQIEASDAYVRVVDDWRQKNEGALTKAQRKQLEKDEIQVRYRAAFLYYDHRHYSEAAARFEAIILKWPQDQWAEKAANLILNSLEVKEQWAQLNDIARKFQGNKRLARRGTSFHKELGRLIEGSAFKIGEDQQKNGELEVAAATFVAFVAEFPKSQYADLALFNTYLIHEGAKRTDKALELITQLHTEYPKSNLQAPALRALGDLHQRVANYEASARFFAAFYDGYQDPKSKDFQAIPEPLQAPLQEALPDALFNAALWSEGLGNEEIAIQRYLQYVERFSKRPDVPDVFYNVGTIYERQGEWKKAISHFSAYQKRYAKVIPGWKYVRSLHRQAKAHEALGDRKAMMKIYDGLVARYPKLSEDDKKAPATRLAVAEAAFVRLQARFDAYMAVDFDTEDQAQVAKRLKSKLTETAAIEASYRDILSYGADRWSVAALTQIGLAYQNFARVLLDAPIPEDFDEDQEELYRATLEERAFPLEDKAIEFLETALAKSYEFNIYSEWTHKAQDTLLAFKPNAYGQIHEVSYKGSEFFNTAGPQAAFEPGEPAAAAPAPAPAGEESSEEEAPAAEEAAPSGETAQAERSK